MGNSSHRQTTRRTNLQALLADAQVGGPTALARKIGNVNLRSHLTNMAKGVRGMGDHIAASIEDALGLPRGWMDRQHQIAGESPGKYTQAQNLSDHLLSDDLPLLSWEAIMKTDKVPDLFRATLPDDALAPDYPAGTEIVWTTRRRASPGRIILVRDRHGQLHARQCHQGRVPGQWIAAPINHAYISLSSQDEGLQLVAVFKGRLEPDD